MLLRAELKQIYLMSLKNGLYLFRETCSSVSLKGSQPPWQTDPYPCSRLGWILWIESVSPPFTPLCTRAGDADAGTSWAKWAAGCPGNRKGTAVSSAVWCLQRTRRWQQVNTSWGIFSGDGPRCPPPTASLPYEQKAQGLVNSHALPFMCITGLNVLPPLILFFSSLASFLGNPLFTSPFSFNFSLFLTFCLVNWLCLLCLSFPLCILFDRRQHAAHAGRIYQMTAKTSSGL